MRKLNRIAIFLVAALLTLTWQSTVEGLEAIVNVPGLQEEAKEDQLIVESHEVNKVVTSEKCHPSEEAKKSKLFDAFKKVQKKYYELHPHMVGTNRDLTDSELKVSFRSFNTSPEHLHHVAMEAKKLLQEMNNKDIEIKSLKPRESRLYSQFEYFLRQTFDNPYQSYYDGLWAIGPDYFCDHMICSVSNHVFAVLKRIKPQNLEDLKLFTDWIRMHKETFEQYLENVKSGPKRGMVFPVDVCKSTAKTFRQMYMPVGIHGPEGARKIPFVRNLVKKEYYSNVPESAFTQYESKYGHEYFKHVMQLAVEYFGKPLHNLMTYLSEEYVQYCVPSHISSGLAKLPLPFVYRNGRRGERTKPTLPTGERIDVAAGYRSLLAYYTTTNITGPDALALGHRLVSKYYEQVVSLAKDVTKTQDQDRAIRKFKALLKSEKLYYNTGPIPESETDDEAQRRCATDHEAQKHCPKRWKALERWFNQTSKIMQATVPAIRHLFHVDGPKKTVPDCLVKLKANYNPSVGVPSYAPSDEDCSEPASYFIPFFKDRMGPKYEDLVINFHEARPGHHLQVQGFLENFGDQCNDISDWINTLVGYYPAFSEGWGLYSENPLLSNDTNLLQVHDKLQTYGMLKWQIWRALRLVVDVGMHSEGMSREEALRLFRKYAWDESDTARKEVTRYQGYPGQATSYTVGQQTLISFRNRAEDQLGDDFDIKDFHYYVLSQGQSPFKFLSDYVDGYISCARKREEPKSEHSEYCDNFFSQPPKRPRTSHDKLMSQVFKLFRKHVHV